MLKADFHLHTNKSEIDRKKIPYSPKELIEFMAGKGFDVISITDHDALTFSEELRKYAESWGIVLIPGIEKTIEGQHILLINFNKNELKKIKKLSDLRTKPNRLIIAPHPFFPRVHGLGNRLINYIHLFDALEHSYFYMRIINFNKKTSEISKQYNKPLIGCSDAHRFWQIGTTYTLIDSNKDKKSIISAIKSNKIILKTKPLSLWVFILISLYVSFKMLLHRIGLSEEE